MISSRFALHDPDGAMGFPGALDVTCTYRLKIPGTLSVELSATCDEPTLCNLAHHSYFNLDDGGSGDILDHRLMLAAHAYLPVDEELIPTGVVQPVDGTAFDFRQARPIRLERKASRFVYDHNFCLAAARGPLRQAAWAQGARRASRWKSGRPSRACSSMPAQRSSGPCRGSAAGVQGLCRLCLEPQIWPDSPNRPYFPQAVLWPGEIYRQMTEYRFRQGLNVLSKAARSVSNGASAPRTWTTAAATAWARRVASAGDSPASRAAR